MEKLVFKNLIKDVQTIQTEFTQIEKDILEQDIFPTDVCCVDNQIHVALNKSYRGSDRLVVEIDCSNCSPEDTTNLVTRVAYGDSHFEINYKDGVNLKGLTVDPRDFPNKQYIEGLLRNSMEAVVSAQLMKQAA